MYELMLTVAFNCTNEFFRNIIKCLKYETAYTRGIILKVVGRETQVVAIVSK